MIIDAGEEKAWVWSPTGWLDISEYMQGYFQSLQQEFNVYTGQLSGWTGEEEWTYTDPTTGMTVRIYGIVANPSLPDSLFQPD